MLILYEKVKKERVQILKEIEELENKISKLPDGKLVITKYKKYTKWYVSDGKELTYIPKKDKALAKKLALKKFFLIRLENKKQELYAIEQYLNAHDSESHSREQAYLNRSEIKELLPIKNPNLTEKLNEWMTESYIKNEFCPEHLIHDTSSGVKVRSKSEVLIEMVLSKYNIPFRYECQLILGEHVFYPDFTIMHPKTGKIYYWEHNGMMDDQAYSKHAFKKIQHYISYGVMPGEQLITTYENRNHPLSIEVVERIVREMFT